MAQLRQTQYGFEWGGAKVERTCHDRRTGAVYITVESEKASIEVYVTKTGKIRVFETGSNREWKP